VIWCAQSEGSGLEQGIRLRLGSSIR